MSEVFKQVKISEAYRLLHPKPVSLIISIRPSGELGVMPAAWITPLSRNPQLVGVSIAPIRHTYEVLRDAGDFTLNVMPKEHIKQVNFLGTISGKEKKDKIKMSGLTLTESRKVKSPHVLEALAVLECVVEKEVEAGDHIFIISRVMDSYVKPDVFDETYLPHRAKILFHLGGTNYVTLSDDVLKP